MNLKNRKYRITKKIVKNKEEFTAERYDCRDDGWMPLTNGNGVHHKPFSTLEKCQKFLNAKKEEFAAANTPAEVVWQGK